MKHLDEFSSFKVKRSPSLFRNNIAVLILRTELNEAKVLVVSDFVDYLSSLGIKADVIKTALEDEDYEITLPERISINDLISGFPTQIEGEEPMTTTNVSIWYADEPNSIAQFTWCWSKGFYKG